MMVMVNNNSGIKVIKIIVVTLFFFTVVLDSKSKAIGISLLYLKPSHKYIQFKNSLSKRTPGLLYVENEKQFCCITGSLAHPKYSLNNTEYNLNYENKIRFLPLIISDYTKERGINPINGPPGQVPDHKTESLLYRPTEITHPHSFSTDQVTDNNINMSDSIEQYPVTILCPPDISIYTDINTCTSYITDKL
ncbi:MAG: hypothetical protein PHG29_04710, partial [Prolixibacteraceae bacterium]|nr:hypothetical protein [Prolixibacteraceae bacterium]